MARGVRGPSPVLRWAPILLVVALVAGPLVSVGNASAANGGTPINAPSFGGVFIVDDGRVFAYLGYAGFANIWTGVGVNGSSVFASQLFLLAYSLVNYTLALPIDVKQAGQPWVNSTVVLAARSETDIPITLAQSTAWTSTVVVMGGVSWSGQVATPLTLLPPYLLNIGGLDLFAMAVIVECIVAFSTLTYVAARLMKRVGYAPKFSLLIWGHVFIFGMLVFVVADYQFIVQTFAGWSPLVYVFPLAVMWFFFALSLFNRTTKREVLQIAARPNQKLAFRRFVLRVGVDGYGRTILYRENWSDFWARAWGHYVYLPQESDPSKPETFLAEVVNQTSPTGTGWRRTRAKRRKTDAFRIVNRNEDAVDTIAFARPGATMVVRWPHLVAHRDVPTPEERDPATGVVTKASGTRRKLAWPHYIDGSAEEVDLENVHYGNAVAVTAGWLRAGDLSRMLGDTETALYVLQSEFASKVAAEVEAILTAYWSLIGRTKTDLTDEEAEAESRKGRAQSTLAEELAGSPLRRGRAGN